MSPTRLSSLAVPCHLLLGLLFANCGGSVQPSDPHDAGGTSGTVGTGGAQSSTGGSGATPSNGGSGAAPSNGGSGAAPSNGGNGAAPSNGGASSVPSSCQLPAAPGNCDAYMPRYYFDVSRGMCQPFVYGGCGGNDNRFDTLADCVNACDPGALDRCVYNDDCTVAQTGCCGACEPTKQSDYTARNSQYASMQNCPGVDCGACPTYDGIPNYPNFGARCTQGRCEVYDVRESDVSSCSSDGDCRLRLGLGCCEGCARVGNWVAVNPAIASTVYFCSGPENCADCARTSPPNWSASCVIGHCQVKRTP